MKRKSKIQISKEVLKIVNRVEIELNYVMGRPISLIVVDTNETAKLKIDKNAMLFLFKRTIEEIFDILPNTIESYTRLPPYPECRYAYMFLYKKYFPNDKLLLISQSIGLKDHTMAVYGLTRHNELYTYDLGYKRLFNKLLDKISEIIDNNYIEEEISYESKKEYSEFI
jgi:chromosomal replication initiation ATPase DnaA